jgi:hypothetical protein
LSAPGHVHPKTIRTRIYKSHEHTERIILNTRNVQRHGVGTHRTHDTIRTTYMPRIQTRLVNRLHKGARSIYILTIKRIVQLTRTEHATWRSILETPIRYIPRVPQTPHAWYMNVPLPTFSLLTTRGGAHHHAHPEHTLSAETIAVPHHCSLPRTIAAAATHARLFFVLHCVQSISLQDPVLATCSDQSWSVDTAFSSWRMKAPGAAGPKRNGACKRGRDEQIPQLLRSTSR